MNKRFILLFTLAMGFGFSVMAQGPDGSLSGNGTIDNETAVSEFVDEEIL